MQAIFHTLHGNSLIGIRDQPVKLGIWKLRTENRIHNIQRLNQFSHIRHTGTLTQQPWNQLKYCNIILVIHRLTISSIPHKIQTRHSKSLFIGTFIIKGIILCHMGHADHRIMILKHRTMFEMEGIVSRCNGDFFTIGKLVIQSSSHVKIFCLISCRCTHATASFIRLL